jgi:hypothetical protein
MQHLTKVQGKPAYTGTFSSAAWQAMNGKVSLSEVFKT